MKLSLLNLHTRDNEILSRFLGENFINSTIQLYIECCVEQLEGPLVDALSSSCKIKSRTTPLSPINFTDYYNFRKTNIFLLYDNTNWEFYVELYKIFDIFVFLV